MSDDHDLQVETAGAGASHTFPLEAGQLKKGDYVCIKGRAVKVVEITTSKTGKHGHAKAHIIGIDIFNGKKLEENSPTTHTMECPRVSRIEYMVADVAGGFVNCLDDAGIEKEFPLPGGEIGDDLQARFKRGDALVVTVVAAMGEEQITAVKEDAKA